MVTRTRLNVTLYYIACPVNFCKSKSPFLDILGFVIADSMYNVLSVCVMALTEDVVVLSVRKVTLHHIHRIEGT